MRSTAVRQRLWRSWVVWTAAGEAVGFCIPAVAALAGSWPLLVAAGMAEGAVLGLAQARVLRRAVPALHAARWVVATSVAAGVAWTIGLTPSLLGDAVASWPPGVLVVGGGVGGAVLLLSIGTAQWIVLRGLVPRAARWIPGTAVAWLAGLGVFFLIATPLWHPGQDVAAIVAIGAVAGLAMALTMAAVTGIVLVHLVDLP